VEPEAVGRAGVGATGRELGALTGGAAEGERGELSGIGPGGIAAGVAGRRVWEKK
jgi:hypothetical protein